MVKILVLQFHLKDIFGLQMYTLVTLAHYDQFILLLLIPIQLPGRTIKATIKLTSNGWEGWSRILWMNGSNQKAVFSLYQNFGYLWLAIKICWVLFFVGVPWSPVFLEIFPTHLTMRCHKCLFHMDNHINQVESVMVVARISRWSCTSENINKKST